MNVTVVLECLAAVISLAAAIIPTFIKPPKSEPSISIKGKSNKVCQDNSVHTQQVTKNYIDNSDNRVVYISASTPGNTMSSDNNELVIVGILLLLAFYANRYFLLQWMYLPILISALLSVIIAVFYKLGKPLLPIHPKRFVNIAFWSAPCLASIIFIIQTHFFLSDLRTNGLAQKIQIATTILFDYSGVSLLLIAQLCVLVGMRIKSNRIKKVLLKFSRLWPAAIICPCAAILIWVVSPK